MKPRAIAGGVLAAFAVGSLAYLVVREVRSGGDGPPLDLPADGVVVFYFHTNRHCPDCEKIRGYAREALEARFADALGTGRLVWRTANIEEKPHRRFAEAYRLVAAAVVVSERRAGREVRWKNLDRVWDLRFDRDRFIAYVAEEVGPLVEGR
jgi:hypothetical protein